MTKSQNIIEITTRSIQFWAGNLAIWSLAAFLYFNFSAQQENYLYKEFETRNATLIAMAASYASPFLQTKNIISLNILLKELTARPEISFGQIVGGSGEVLTEVGDIRIIGVRLNQAINFNDELIGHIRLTVNHNLKNNDLMFLFIVFSLLTSIGWGLFCFWQTMKNQSNWTNFNKSLLPILEVNHNSPVEWNSDLKENAQPILSIVTQLKQRMTQEQIELLSLNNQQQVSRFKRVVLLNCAQIKNTQDAMENQANAYKLQIWLDQVAHIYQGQRIENGNLMAFDLDDDEDAAVNALYAARVLFFLCQNTMNCAISLSAGELWVGSGLSPWPVIRASGTVVDDIQHVHLHNPGEFVLMTESLFQYSVLNERIIASIYKDLIKVDGGRLEVWQLDGLQGQYDTLLRNQADRLPELC